MFFALSPTFQKATHEGNDEDLGGTNGDAELPFHQPRTLKEQRKEFSTKWDFAASFRLSFCSLWFSGRYFFLERERESRRGRGRRVGERKAVWPRRPEEVGRETRRILCACASDGLWNGKMLSSTGYSLRASVSTLSLFFSSSDWPWSWKQFSFFFAVVTNL